MGGIYFWFIILTVLVWIPDQVIEVNAGIFLSAGYDGCIVKLAYVKF